MKQAFGPYQNKTLNDFEIRNDAQQEAVDQVRGYLQEVDKARQAGRGLTFLGPNGVGKTLLASIVLNEVVERGYRIEAIELAVYVGLHKSKFDLQGTMRDTDDERIVDEYIRLRQHLRYIQGISKHSADWVLFDDVGREFPSESGWSQYEFFDTLRSRWHRGRPTLLTTNLTMPDLERRYTEGLTSLLMESSEVIVVEGDDFRWRRVS